MNNTRKNELDMWVLGKTGLLLTSLETLIFSRISQTHGIDRRWSNIILKCKSCRACFVF